MQELAVEIKEKYPEKTIWLYTGDCWEELRHNPFMEYVDVLVDGEFKEEERDVKLLWKGSKNQRVIDVKASLYREEGWEPIFHCGEYYERKG